MQCFASALAKLCIGTCKALRWHMQSFALAHAMLCVGQYTAVRLPTHSGASADEQCLTYADYQCKKSERRVDKSYANRVGGKH